MGFSLKTTVMISDKIISPLQSVNPGGAEKVDWYAPTKTAFVITGEYTDDKGGQVVAVDYSKGFDQGVAIDEYYFEGDVSDVRVSSKGLIAASVLIVIPVKELFSSWTSPRKAVLNPWDLSRLVSSLTNWLSPRMAKSW